MRKLAIALLLVAAACGEKKKVAPPPPDADATSVNTDTLLDTTPNLSPEVQPEDTLPAEVSGRSLVALTQRGPSGLPIGLNAVDLSVMQQYGLTGSYQSSPADVLSGFLRSSANAGIARVVALPRRYQTSTGTNNGPYCVKCTWKALDEYGKISPDTVKKYTQMGVFRGFSLMDDLGCGSCWGKTGVTISHAQVDSVYQYAEAKLWPTLAVKDKPVLFIRAHPLWFTGHVSQAKSVGGFWMQYVQRKESAQSWYDRNTKFAAALGQPVGLIYGVNFKNFNKTSSNTAATASQLREVGRLAITYPNNCMFAGYQYWSGWRADGRASVWDELVVLARNQPASSCHP